MKPIICPKCGCHIEPQQRRAALARVAKLTPEERSAAMKRVRAGGKRLEVFNQEYPSSQRFSSEEEALRHALRRRGDCYR